MVPRGHRQLRGHWGPSMAHRCHRCSGIYLGEGFCNSPALPARDGCRRSIYSSKAWQRAQRRQDREDTERQAEEQRRGPNLPSGSASTSAGQGAAEPLSASAPGSGGAASSRFAAGAQAEEAAVAGMSQGSASTPAPPDAVAEAVALLARLQPLLIRMQREEIVWEVDDESADTVRLLVDQVWQL